MSHLGGKKFSRRHTTAIPATVKLAKFLARHNLVNKIIVGEIKPIRVGPKRLKIQPIEAGVKLTVRDTSARQTVFIYTADSPALTAIIERFWQENIES